MPEPTLAEPVSRDLPEAAVTSFPKTQVGASESITAKGLSNQAREDQTRRPSEEQIRARAYEIYVESGYEEGRAEQHWLAAEQELLDESD